MASRQLRTVEARVKTVHTIIYTDVDIRRLMSEDIKRRFNLPVDPRALAIDSRLGQGDVTLVSAHVTVENNE